VLLEIWESFHQFPMKMDLAMVVKQLAQSGSGRPGNVIEAIPPVIEESGPINASKII
jgi:hypothetical protein